jgi:hypothetical protein
MRSRNFGSKRFVIVSSPLGVCLCNFALGDSSFAKMSAEYEAIRSDELGEWFARYKCKKCPLQHECSDGSWDRAHVQGGTFEAGQAKLRAHLKNSSKHYKEGMTEEDVEDLVLSAEFDYDEVFQPFPALEPTQPDEPPTKKAKGKGKGKDDGKDKRHLTAGDAKRIAEDAAMAVLHGAGLSTASGSQQGSMSASGAGGALQVFNRGADDKVTMSRQTFEMVKDTVDRNKRACKQALTFFEAGVSAFKDELRVCDDCLDAMKQAEGASRRWSE